MSRNETQKLEANTVSETVLLAYFAELSKVEGFKEVAENLKKVIVDDKVYAEPAIRAAMFPES